MFEIIKALLECVSKLIDPVALSKHSKERRTEELGAKLFMLYAVIDDICIDGEQIISDLETYVERMDKYASVERDRWALGGLKCISGISSHLEQQLRNIGKAQTVLVELSTELHLIDPVGYRKLVMLTRGVWAGKTHALEALDGASRLLKEGYVPLLGPTEEELQNVALEFAQNKKITEALETSGALNPFEPEEAIKLLVEQIRNQYDKGAVRSSGLWDEYVFQMVKEYLANRKPRSQIAEIRAVATDLRTTLNATYSLSDILWLVGTRKFRSRYGSSPL